MWLSFKMCVFPLLFFEFTPEVSQVRASTEHKSQWGWVHRCVSCIISQDPPIQVSTWFFVLLSSTYSSSPPTPPLQEPPHFRFTQRSCKLCSLPCVPALGWFCINSSIPTCPMLMEHEYTLSVLVAMLPFSSYSIYYGRQPQDCFLLHSHVFFMLDFWDCCGKQIQDVILILVKHNLWRFSLWFQTYWDLIRFWLYHPSCLLSLLTACHQKTQPRLIKWWKI